MPSIHPWLAICGAGETTCHQHAFAVAAGSPRGVEAMLLAAKSLARTAADVVEDAALRAAVRAEFDASRG